MVGVDVEYCAPCRLAGTTMTTRRVLADRLREYDETESVRVEPTQEDVFCVSVDGDRISSVDPRGRVDPMEAVGAVRSWLRS
jgi:hypothetical protein